MSEPCDFNKISLYKYYIFIKVISYKSIQRAARHFDIAVFKLKNDIISIEKALGVELFERNKKEFVLTEEGKKFASLARSLFDEFGQLKKDRVPEDEELVISTYYGFAETVLPQALAGFSKRHPNIRLKVLAGIEHVDFTDLDIDVLIAAPLSNRVDLRSMHLVTSLYQFYASSDYLKENGVPESIDDLMNRKLILFKRMKYQQNSVLGKLQPNIEAANFGFLFKMCKFGHGIALLPNSRLQNDDSYDKTLIKILGDEVHVDFSTHFMVRRFSHKSHLMNDLFECLIDVLEDRKNEKNFSKE